MRFAVKIL